MILLSFDNPNTYSLSRKLSEMIGCRVIIVSNLLEALDVLDKESVEMLLIDLCPGQAEAQNTQLINHIQKGTIIMFHYQLYRMSTEEIAHLVSSLYAMITLKRLLSDSVLPVGHPSIIRRTNDMTFNDEIMPVTLQ